MSMIVSRLQVKSQRKDCEIEDLTLQLRKAQDELVSLREKMEANEGEPVSILIFWRVMSIGLSKILKPLTHLLESSNECMKE